MDKSFWMLLASLLFSLMAVFGKIGAADFGVFEIVFWRSLMGMVFLLIWAAKTGNTVRTPLVGSHLLRSFYGTAAITAWFYAIGKLPLGTALTLNYTSSIFMTLIVIVVAVMKRLPIDRRMVAAVILGFVGVMLVLQPEMRGGDIPAAAVGLFSGFISALAYFQIKTLSDMHEPEWRIVFYFTLFGTVWGAAGQLIIAGGFSPITLQNAWALLGIGVSATLAQLAMTRSWGSDNLLLACIFQYSAIIFAVIFGVVLFDDPVTLTVLSGTGVILASGVWASMLSKTDKKAKS